MLSEGETHATQRAHGENSRYQAGKGMELEIQPPADRRLFAGAARRRAPWPDETDQAAGDEGGRALRVDASGDHHADRDPNARRRCAHGAHGSTDLSLLR